MIAEIPSGAFEIPDYALWTLGVGVLTCLIAGLIGYRFTWGRYDGERRINFVSQMCELRAALNKIDDYDFRKWFATTQVEVEKNCALVESAIRWRCRKQFVAARKKCSETQVTNDPRPPQAGLLFGVLPVGMASLPQLTYSASRQHIDETLNNLIDAAK